MSLDNASNLSDPGSILAELTAEKLEQSIPVLCLISVLMLVGTFGNALVIATYFKRAVKSSTNLFIFCLAMFDITNCTVALPLEIYNLSNPYMNDHGILCKIHRFIAFSADLSSGFIIVCISFDRYLRIARPHQGLSVKGSKMCIFVICILAVLISSFSFVVYGRAVVSFPEHPGIVGIECGVPDDRRQTVFPLLFNTLILVSFCVGVIILLIVYTLLGLKVRRWNEGRKTKIARTNRALDYSPATAISEDTGSPDTPEQVPSETFAFLPPSPQPPTQQAADSPDDANTKEEPFSFKRPSFVRELSRSLDRNHFLKLDTELHMNGTQTLPHRKSSTSKNRKSCTNMPRKASIPKLNELKRRMKISRTTIMFITATIAFVASHLPYACIKLAYTVTPSLTDSMSGVAYSFFLFAEFSFVVSYAVNPIIYSFLNPKYRRECKSILQDLSSSLKCQSKQFFIR